jgi:predicted phosphodiesterase
VSDSLRLVLLSDTHGMHDRIDVPAGDVLVHAGDFCSNGSEAQARAFAAFWAAQPHPHKVVIAGNHDRCLESDPTLGPALFGPSYLIDEGREVAGLRVYGAPWQPWFLDWAFNLQRGESLRAKWALIPEGLDLLVTHGPPQHVLDRTFTGDAVGCADLAAAIERTAPRLHVFGHIHEGYGSERRGATLHVNASNCTLQYEPINRPIAIDLPRDRAAPATVV